MKLDYIIFISTEQTGTTNKLQPLVICLDKDELGRRILSWTWIISEGRADFELIKTEWIHSI